MACASFNICNPAAAAPIEPVTYSTSPGRAPRRVSVCRLLHVPVTVTSIEVLPQPPEGRHVQHGAVGFARAPLW